MSGQVTEPLLHTIEPDEPGESAPSGNIGIKPSSQPREQIVLTPSNNAAAASGAPNPNATPGDMESGEFEYSFLPVRLNESMFRFGGNLQTGVWLDWFRI
jgi:hypothetical protein